MDYRQYDGARGRFDSIDVLAEVFPEESPFNFSLNNPVYFNDPTGLCPECEKNVKNPTAGQSYTSTGGATYVYNNGQWTQQGGQLAEVTVTATAKKKSTDGQAGKKPSEPKTALFGLIQNANVNSQGQSPLEVYRENRGNSGYNAGEDKWDRMFRLMGNSHIEIMQDFGGGGYNMWGGYGRALQATKAVQATEGAFSVYQGFDSAGVVRYVGITSRNPLVRFAEHLSSMSQRASLRYEVIEGATNLTKEQAKVLEQTLINQYRLQKNGGQLFNEINSIAPRRWGAYGIGQ